jgi:hypothetical protein
VKHIPFGMALSASSSFPGAAAAQSSPASPGRDRCDRKMPQKHEMEVHGPDHGLAVPVSYSGLTKPAALLEKARRATEKYKDVRLAAADAYQAIGPDAPGMGIHYIGSKGGAGFVVELPPILLHEKDPSVAGGYQLVGVRWLLSAVEGPDGQPQDAPFPKPLAPWHHHANNCVLADRSVGSHLNDNQCCSASGGHFPAKSQSMVDARIWKDTPMGVFAPTNPSVQSRRR